MSTTHCTAEAMPIATSHLDRVSQKTAYFQFILMQTFKQKWNGFHHKCSQSSWEWRFRCCSIFFVD